jgi:hypothetical protein
MWHSSLDLTMNVYTDPSLLDVSGALETLREVSLGGTLRPDGLRATATRHTGRTRC